MSSFSRAFERELAHLARDRWDQALLFAMPLLLLGVLAAMLLAGAPRELPVAVVGPDTTRVQALARAIDETEAVRVVAHPASEGEALSLVRRGTIVAFVEIPERATSPARVSYNAAYLSAGGIARRAIAGAVREGRLDAALDDRGLSGILVAQERPPPVSFALLGNPAASFEWYLQALVDPAVLHLLVACATAMAMGRRLEQRSLAAWARASGGIAGALVGKLLPYVAIVTAWGAVWMIWIAGARGWAPAGSLFLVLAGQALLYAATAALSALLVALSRDTSSALAASAVYAGSALAYSGGSLPVAGGSLFARGWSGALPFTHYLDLQMDQWLGAPPSVALGQLGLLSLYVLVPGALAWWLIRREAAA